MFCMHFERFGASCFWCFGTDFVQPSLCLKWSHQKTLLANHSQSPVCNGAKLHCLLSSSSEHGSWLAEGSRDC